MTRAEFIDIVVGFYDLRDFCNDKGIEYCQYVMDRDELDEYLDEYVRNNVYTDGWERIRDFLDDVDTEYNFFDTEYDITGLCDDDFEEWKEEVLNIADGDNLWDEEPEEEEDIYEEVDFAYDDEESESISENELMSLLGGQTA